MRPLMLEVGRRRGGLDMNMDLQFLMCPACGTPLDRTDAGRSPEIEESDLVCALCAHRWAVHDGIPDFTFPDELRGKDSSSRTFWNRIAHLYGGINLFTGLLRGVSIRDERQKFIERLGLRSGAAVLELAAGTGSNLALLAEKVGESGTVFGLDLSSRMLGIAQGKLKNLSRPPRLVLGNSQHLPFVDGVFDAVLDGAGSKYYSD